MLPRAGAYAARMSSLDAVIQSRRTTKVFAESPDASVTTDRGQINELIAAAAWAPFHRPANKVHLSGPHPSLVPWRFHAVDAAGCRVLRSKLIEAGDAGKLPQMLAAAECVIHCTWLPDSARTDDPVPEGHLFEPTISNMEHIAAAGAAIQNLLLAATDRGFDSYWSSGGALRGEQAFGWLGIPTEQILLGAIFLFPSEADGTERVPGKLREKRGADADWSRWVDLTD